MPPHWDMPLSGLRQARGQSQTHTDFVAVESQWKNPTDILTILMIIGGDVVQCALAQLSAGPWLITPVAFSFGWVAYSFSAILFAVGSGRVIPEPDTEVTCINVKSGHDREVKSWVLARLYRDLVPIPPTSPAGLTVLFYDTTPAKPTGFRDPDWVFYLGIAVIALQLGIACIPGGLNGNWVILIITAGGTLLAQLGAALPQWREEMWCARKLEEREDKVEVVCLTGGNGSSHVVVIKSIGCGRRLEDLAGGRTVPSRFTSVATFVLAILWIVHLITVQGVVDGGWYLLAVGGLGMTQNVVSAGARRVPAALGFHIKERRTIHRNKVFEALQVAEEEEERVGLSLLDVFFPRGL
ncbi:uncharacterized protein PHACADRAFT_256516, partial [Phanerochaete carnosa HHB-10118-sp]